MLDSTRRGPFTGVNYGTACPEPLLVSTMFGPEADF
jgi:hypothetical protein